MAGAHAPDPKRGDRLLAQLTSQHPLQPFSKTYFLPSREPDIFTYAREWRRIFDPGKEPPASRLLEPPQFESRLTLAQLIRFLKNPVQYFFNQRLNVYFEDIQVTTLDQEPFALDHLAPFGLGIQLLKAGLAADSTDSAAAVEQDLLARNVIPERLSSYGRGESEPRATNATEEGRRLNRRVEIIIVPVVADS